MSTLERSLPESWIEKIWSAMRATYGAAFDRQWQCPAGEDPVRHVMSLKAHWARELGGFLERGDAIRHALENLPEHPPNLVQFRGMCNRAPDKPVPALPAPKPDPKRVAEALASIKPLESRPDRAWAVEMRDRERRYGGELSSGKVMGPYHRAAWREALGADWVGQ